MVLIEVCLERRCLVSRYHSRGSVWWLQVRKGMAYRQKVYIRDKSSNDYVL